MPSAKLRKKHSLHLERQGIQELKKNQQNANKIANKILKNFYLHIFVDLMHIYVYYRCNKKGGKHMTQKKRYTINVTEDTAKKFEELVEFYSMPKSAVMTLLIREDYERRIQGKELEQKK